MKTISKSKHIVGLLLTLVIGLNACSKVKGEDDFAENNGIIDVAADGTTLLMKANLESVFTENLTFSEAELDILLHMKEEEKLAGDVYKTLYEKWGSNIFSNISKAEDTHMNAVILLLQNYGEEFTKVGDRGIFSNPDFQTLYGQLVAKGSVSLEEAYKTGALIEEMDIKDLADYLESMTNENIIMVFENLEKGSRNHLRAFNRQLVRLGVTYTPVYISQEKYDQIVSSPNESGNQYQKNGKGRNCKRNGQG